MLELPERPTLPLLLKKLEAMKLHYTAHEELGLLIEDIQIDRNIEKQEALKYLVDLANENMEYPIRDFAGDKDVSCTLPMTDKEYSNYKDYRKRHRLTKKNEFFRDALKRGAAYYQDMIQNKKPKP